jgi:hypothetical protein
VEPERVLLTRGAGQTAQNLVVRLIGGLISRRAFINARAKPSEYRGFGHSLKRRACQIFTARETDILVSRGLNCIFNEGAKLIKLVLLQIMGNDSISARSIELTNSLTDSSDKSGNPPFSKISDAPPAVAMGVPLESAPARRAKPFQPEQASDCSRGWRHNLRETWRPFPDLWKSIV